MMVKSNLIYDDELRNCKKYKKQNYKYKTITPEYVQGFIADGWEIEKEFKKSFRMKKLKPFDEIFENEVWVLFNDLGFKMMNENRSFVLPYDNDKNLTQQIDVFAADDETILLIECKATETKNKKKDFKNDLEAFGGKKEGILKYLKKEFPDHKVKFVFATKNYNVGQQDLERMKFFDISYFDEEKILYYKQLAGHLGHAARYQLLGNLFAKQKIKGLENVVPAISGKMGGYNYFSFSIEPETLLKLGYVLHRTDSNKDSMPTYQRLIKKSRLNSIQEFIENGGYFPNSIIVSIEAGGKGLKFEKVNQGSSNSLSKLGLLYLPQTYKSIYIIDGQHRLYGYSNSQYRKTNTIPVVAFENLKQEEQVKIFMDINENQKAVPKNLRNTLDEDLKINSIDQKERREGLALKIARELGEDRNSPLYGRVVVGENLKTSERCITLETLSKSLRESDFFSKYNKNSVLISNGKLDLMDNDKTFNKIYPLLTSCLVYIKEGIGDKEWMKTDDDKIAFIKNNIISGLIRTFNSLLNYLSDTNKINTLSDNPTKICCEMQKYLDIIVAFWDKTLDEDKVELSSSYGAGGPIKTCRTFEREINAHFSSFNPEGLTKYWSERNKENIADAKKMCDSITDLLKEKVKRRLDNYYGEDQFQTWAPKDVVTEISGKVTEFNYGKTGNQRKDIWDFVSLEDMQKIIINGTNWSEVFDKKFSFPEDTKGDKREKTKWMIGLYEVKKHLETSSMISGDDYEFVKNINEWLVNL